MANMNVTVIDQNNVKISIDRGLIGPQGISGFSGISGYSGYSGISGYSGSGISGYSGYSGQQGTSINVKGEVPTVGDLPPTGNQVNDAYIVTADGDLWIWDGSAWFDAGQIVGPQGFSGFSGFSGESGYSGFSGISGYSGSGVSGWSGDSGISGYSGWSGESGFSGISGFSGDSGISGFSGESGYSGWSGESGYSGFSGSGVSGWSGESGISGFSGYSGISGYSGDSGISGFSGDSGISGWSGESGYSGFSGDSGISGWSGDSGISGFSGESGYSGWSGEVGASGFSGESGYSGFSGESGYSGYSGAVGESGYSGISGYSGESGISGWSGDSGISGWSGDSGISGYSGDSGISGFSGYSGYSGAIGQSSSLFLYDAEAVDTSGQPANGFLLWNNATQINATQINVSHLTSNGIDIDIFLALLQPTQKFTIQDQNASANYQSWLITGATTNINPNTANSYWTIPVSLISSGGTGTTDFPNNHPLFLAVTAGVSGTSGYSGYSGYSGISGFSGISGYSGASGISGQDGVSGFSGASGFSGISGYSGFSGISGIDGASGYSGYSGISGASGFSGISGYSGYSGIDGASGYSGISGYSGSGVSGYSGFSGISGYSGYSGITPTIGGSNTQVQFNNSGVLGGSANLTFNGSTLTASNGNGSASFIANSTANTPYLRFDQSGSAKFTIGESSIVGGGSGYYDFYAVASVGQRFWTNAVQAMTLETTGNLTLNVATGMLSAPIARIGTYTAFGTESLQVAKANGTGAVGSAYQFAINSKGSTNRAEMILTDGATANAFISYKPSGTAANNILTFNVGSSDVLNVVGTGYVGIGVTNPSSKLQVVDQVGGLTTLTLGNSVTQDYCIMRAMCSPLASGGYTLLAIQAFSSLVSSNVNVGTLGFTKEGSGTDNKSYFDISTHNGTSLAQALRITSNGNVGINTNDPDYGSYGATEKILGVTGVATNRGRLSLQNTSTGTTGAAGTIAFFNGSTLLGAIDVVADGATNKGFFDFNTNDGTTFTTRMRILSSGNVIIGDTSIDSGFRLNVVGGGIYSLKGSDGIAFQTSNLTSADFNITTSYALTNIGTSGNALKFTTGSERMRITSTGVVNIGSPPPAGVTADGNLVVAGSVGTGQGSTNVKTQINIYETTSNTAIGLWFGARTDETTGVIGPRTATGNIAFETYTGGWTEKMRLTNAGNFLVGTTSFASSSPITAGLLAGNFRSLYGSAAVAGLATATILTLSSSAVGTYIIQANFGAQGAEIYGGMLIVVANAGSFRVVTNGSGTNCVLTLSGANVQITNAIGSALDATGSAILIANGT